ARARGRHPARRPPQGGGGSVAPRAGDRAMTDVAARIQTGLANAWATLARAAHGTVEGVDGLVVALTEIDDPQLTVALVEHPPMHPDSALAGAQAMFSEHGQRIGIDLARGHHPEVEVAARKLGLVVG